MRALAEPRPRHTLRSRSIPGPGVTSVSVVESYEDRIRRGGAEALRAAARFFMCTDDVHTTLRRFTAKLDELGIPYAVADGMALVAHGYRRTTVEVDVLLSPDSLPHVHAELEGRGYLPPFAGSKDLRDTQTGVRIEFLLAGQFPGDGEPKPIAFPDPSTSAVTIDGISFLALERLIELKLASGMTHPGRIKDLADVQELIRVLRLDATFASRLHAYVRPKYAELLAAIVPERGSGAAGPDSGLD